MVMMRLMLNGSMDLYIHLLDEKKILQIMISGRNMEWINPSTF